MNGRIEIAYWKLNALSGEQLSSIDRVSNALERIVVRSDHERATEISGIANYHVAEDRP